MAGSENLPLLPLPDDRTWSSIGVVCGQELHGGYQSRIFAGACGGDRVVVKLTDSRLVDQAYRRRVETTSLLAERDDSVVGPLTTKAGVIVEIGTWLAVVYPFIAGKTPTSARKLTSGEWRRRWQVCTARFNSSTGSTA